MPLFVLSPILACSGSATPETPPIPGATADTAALASTGFTSETGGPDTGGSDTGSAGTGDTAVPSDRFDEFVTVTQPPTSSGTFGCWSPGQPFSTATLNPANQGLHLVTTTFLDWGLNQAVSGTIEVYDGDTPTGTPEHVWTTGGAAGVADVDLPTCTPVTVRATTDASMPPSRVTLIQHDLIRIAANSQVFQSFSETSHADVHDAYGVTPLPGHAMIAGTVLDCIGQPVANVQVLARDAGGVIPADLSAHYYGYDSWWDPAQPWTEDYDGRFFLLNLPAGPMTLEVWAYIGGTHVLVATTELESVADAVLLQDLKYGTSDGVVPPFDCD